MPAERVAGSPTDVLGQGACVPALHEATALTGALVDDAATTDFRLWAAFIPGLATYDSQPLVDRRCVQHVAGRILCYFLGRIVSR